MPRHGRRKLTLVEILVLVAMAAILLGIIGPGIKQARDRARSAQAERPAASSTYQEHGRGNPYFWRP
jgi:Tfp pilus assembly protein FimT